MQYIEQLGTLGGMKILVSEKPEQEDIQIIKHLGN